MEYFKNKTTELKREWNKDKCLREIVAFLNTRDGVVYIGVNDDGTIYGVNNLEKTLSEIKDCIADMILPQQNHYMNCRQNLLMVNILL